MVANEIKPNSVFAWHNYETLAFDSYIQLRDFIKIGKNNFIYTACTNIQTKEVMFFKTYEYRGWSTPINKEEAPEGFKTQLLLMGIL